MDLLNLGILEKVCFKTTLHDACVQRDGVRCLTSVADTCEKCSRMHRLALHGTKICRAFRG